MANLLDYLDWRGDLTLAQAPFNEVDNLILSELSLVDFSGIVPGLKDSGSIPLYQAADAFFQQYAPEEEIDRFMQIKLTHKQREDILYNNTANLLGI